MGGGELVLNVPVEIFYDGTQFNIIGPTVDEKYIAASAACTGAITTAAVWTLVRNGRTVTLTIPATSGTATAQPSFVFGTVIPAKFRPATGVLTAIPMKNNSAYQAGPGALFVDTSGVITCYRLCDLTSNFTNGANAGTDYAASISWII